MKKLFIIFALCSCGYEPEVPSPPNQNNSGDTDNTFYGGGDDQTTEYITVRPSQLGWWCGFSDADDCPDVRTTFVVNKTSQTLLILAPYIEGDDFTITSFYKYPVSLEPEQELPLSVQFNWSSEVKYGDLIIPTTIRDLQVELSGKHFLFYD